MRTKVIPAQITTVEDKIAGNYSFVQIILLMIPVIFTAFSYAFLIPVMNMVWYKAGLIVVTTIISIVLSFRIKGRIVASWLSLVARYNLRPRYYIYNKNDVTCRELHLPEIKKVTKSSKASVKAKAKQAIKQPRLSIVDLISFERATTDKSLGLHFVVDKKGGLNVAYTKVK